MRHNFKKQFGQNFLKTQRFVYKLIEPMELEAGDIVIEIGPGDGLVTGALLNKDVDVVSIEVDYDLLPKLLKKFGENSKFHLVNSDVLDLDFQKMLETEIGDYKNRRVHLTGSLPYNISKQIIRKALEHAVNNQINLVNMSFIVQHEVAKAYVASPPKATFLSMSSRVFANIKKLESIPASQFVPRPKVDGGILLFEIKNDIYSNYKELIKLIKIGFSAPRKTLYNNLKNSAKYSNDIEKIINEVGLNPKARPSEVELEQWVSLFEKLSI